MVRNVKMSIILVLSITIVAAVLVTGTIVNIVSAANSINAQTKASQHPVTRTASPHIVSSAQTHGFNAQTKTNQHPITKTLKGPAGAQCWDVRYYPTPPYGSYPVQVNCEAKFVDLYVRATDPSLSKFVYGGKLLGWVGAPAGYPGTGAGWYGIDNAPIEIKVKLTHAHGAPDAWYTPGVVGKTRLEDATFSGSFSLCDNVTSYGGPIAYFLTYVKGPPGQYVVTIPSKHDPPYPGPYSLPAQQQEVHFLVATCKR
jgi:hypothetical protein